MFTDGLRHASNHQFFSASNSIAYGYESNSVANRFADARRHAGADAAAGRVNTATDAGSNAATSGASDDGGLGQNHEFRVHPFES
jgi:hypothetical protein